jgi:hypothetical protein
MKKISEILLLMQKKKAKYQFKSYTLNIVYDSICEVIKVCHKLPKSITDCFRENIIKELKHFSNDKISEIELIQNSLNGLISCINSYS